MSNSVSTLLTRNLRDVLGENDPVRVAIDELYTEDGVFYDPSKGAFRGCDEIDRIAVAMRATHPAFQYQPIAEPEELGDGGRVQWVSGRPGEVPAYAGTDFIVARDGHIAALYLFFDKQLLLLDRKGVLRSARLRRAAKALSKTVLNRGSVRMTENNTSRKTTSANEKG